MKLLRLVFILDVLSLTFVARSLPQIISVNATISHHVGMYLIPEILEACNHDAGQLLEHPLPCSAHTVSCGVGINYENAFVCAVLRQKLREVTRIKSRFKTKAMEIMSRVPKGATTVGIHIRRTDSAWAYMKPAFYIDAVRRMHELLGTQKRICFVIVSDSPRFAKTLRARLQDECAIISDAKEVRLVLPIF